MDIAVIWQTVLLAIINFNMPDILQTVPDSQIITMKQNVPFQEGYALKNFDLIKFKLVDLQPLLILICVISKTVPDSLIITIKQNGRFQGVICPENVKMADYRPLIT